MGVVADVQAYCEAQSLVDGTDWLSLRRRHIDAQDQIVVFTEDGGPQPLNLPASDGMGDEAWGDAGVQVFVRGPEHDGDASYSKAEAIRTALHGLAPVTMNGTLYYRVQAMTPEPVFIGFDDKGRPQHTIAFRLAKDL